MTGVAFYSLEFRLFAIRTWQTSREPVTNLLLRFAICKNTKFLLYYLDLDALLG